MKNYSKGDEMRVLITGASGFIGSYIASGLTKAGYEVTNFDRVSFIKEPGKLIKNLISTHAIVHCAGLAHTKLRADARTRIKVYNANVDLTKKLCEAAVSANVRKFIFLSSAKVYGPYSQNGDKFCESHKIRGEDLYAESKIAAEKVISQQFYGKKTKYTILRLPLTYSFENKANLARLERLVGLGIPLPFGAIKNKRSLLHLSNLFDVINLILTNTDGGNAIYNVCDDVSVSTSELVKLIADAKNKKARLYEVKPDVFGKVLKLFGYSEIYHSLWQSFEIDTTLIKSELSWTPSYNINKLMEAYRK